MREVLPALMAAYEPRRGRRDGDRCPDVALGPATRRGLDARDRGRRGGRLGQRRLRRGRALRARHRGARRRRRRSTRPTASPTTTRSRSASPAAASSRSSSSGSSPRDLARAAGHRGERRGRGAGRASPPIVKGPHHVGRHLVVRADGVEGSPRARRASTTRSAPTSWACSSRARPGFLHYGPDGERLGTELEVFVASFAPAPRMVIFGAIDFSAALAKAGKLLGLPRHRRRRARGLRHPQAVPRRRRGRRRLAAPLARLAGGRPAHRDLRAHPRPEVRRARAGAGA